MIRFLLSILALTASTATAQDADTRDIDLTPLIASVGLADTVTALEADPPGPGRDFAIGGVQFLRGIEKTLQLRYRHNADFGDLNMPVLRLPLPPNPKAAPFYPALVTDLFGGLVADMQTARTALESANADFGVTIDLTRVWFDINENGVRDAGESLMDAAGAAFGRAAPDDELNSLVVRFDTADAAWLAAYAHLLEGVGHLVLAFDPTEVIDEVLQASAEIAALRGDMPNRPFLLPEEDKLADTIAIVYGALNRQPDATHTRALRQSLLAMIAENRRFWTLVGKETDNDREWLPAAGQVSAFGIELPKETETFWLAVLTDAEQLLTGERLFGHWRLDRMGGVNVAKLLDDPVPVDIVTWLHGHGLLDYMENGPIIDANSLFAFQAMFGGDALLFMVWLN